MSPQIELHQSQFQKYLERYSTLIKSSKTTTISLFTEVRQIKIKEAYLLQFKTTNPLSFSFYCDRIYRNKFNLDFSGKSFVTLEFREAPILFPQYEISLNKYYWRINLP